mgnify:CR=1 FL=1
MSILIRRSSIAAISALLASAAFAQDQTDPFAELGLIDEPSVAEEESLSEGAEIEADEPERPLAEEDVLREYARFVRLLEEENYDAADIAAKRVIEMSIKIYGPQFAADQSAERARCSPARSRTPRSRPSGVFPGDAHNARQRGSA